MPSGLRVCGECGRPLNQDYVAPLLPDNAVADAQTPELRTDDELTALELDELLPITPELNSPETLKHTALATSSTESVHEAARSTSADSSAAEAVDETIIAELVVDETKDEASVLAHTGVVAVREKPGLLARRQGLSRRRMVALITVGAVATLGILAGIVAGGVLLWGQVASAAPGSADDHRAPSATPTVSSTVTLPGFETTAAWSTVTVTVAAAAADRVLSVSAGTVEIRDVVTGKVLSSAPIDGADVRAASGFVSGTDAVAAVSDTQALIWVDGADAPLTIALEGGRTLEVRSGAFVVAGPDRAFWIVTAVGEVPVTAPHPQSIVLGVTGESVIWAAAPHQVTIASPNGAVVSDVTLAPPAPDATITPRRGWVRAANGTTVVVGWTLADGSTVTGVHATSTGALVASFPDAGDGALSPEGIFWLASGQLVDLTNTTVEDLPDTFVSSGALFLGRTLYGAIAAGGNALLQPGEDAPDAVPASTVRPFAIATSGDHTVLLTLAGGSLAAYMTSEK